MKTQATTSFFGDRGGQTFSAMRRTWWGMNLLVGSMWLGLVSGAQAQSKIGDNVFQSPDVDGSGRALIEGANTLINFFFMFLYVASFFLLGAAWLKYKEENYKDALKFVGAAVGVALTPLILRFAFGIGARAAGQTMGF